MPIKRMRQLDAMRHVKWQYIPNGLIGWWKLDGDAKDSSGSGLDGTAYNVSYVDGVRNKCVSFNGSSSYIEVLDNPLLHFGYEDFSYALWFKVNNIQANTYPQLIMKRVYSGGDFEAQIGYAGNYDRLFVIFEDSSGINPINVEATETGKWYFLTVVRKNGTAYVYLNAEQVTSSNANYDVTTTAKLYFGYDAVAGGDWLDGYLDDIMLFNRALTEDEIKMLYKGEYARILLSVRELGARR